MSSVSEVMPEDLTLKEAEQVNADGAKYDGIEEIKSDGTLVLTDEAAIPEGYWKAQAPKLDRQGLISALSAGRDVPGALLGNAPMTISVRTK